ncbi:MAG: ionic transporter y4hA [Actinobacteria bacterium]|nr:ionic transporter y4hA [Actinomycetota bacterium]
MTARPRWYHVLPLLALVALAFSYGRDLGAAAVTVCALLLAGAVLAAVQHAEIVAHKVGEPFGSLVLAVAVTVIEVSLILTLMIAGPEKSATLARDTVFAAVMITLGGIIGISLFVATRGARIPRFNAEGSGGALATVATLTTLTLIFPSVTTSAPGPVFTPGQLTFAAVSALLLYAAFVSTQTVRHRDFFLPVAKDGSPIDGDDHADPPTTKTAWISLGLLLVSLVAVVGLAKVESPAIESGVRAAGLPHSFVGVVIALLVLLPETIAAANAARRGRLQTSMNLALGSAMASIGLTIPTLAIAVHFIDAPLVLGLGPTQITLAVLTFIVATLTIVPGRATRLQAMVHLAIFASFVFLAMSP